MWYPEGKCFWLISSYFRAFIYLQIIGILRGYLIKNTHYVYVVVLQECLNVQQHRDGVFVFHYVPNVTLADEANYLTSDLYVQVNA